MSSRSRYRSGGRPPSGARPAPPTYQWSSLFGRTGRSNSKIPLPALVGSVLLVVVLCGLGAMSEGFFGSGDSSTVVEMPEAPDRAAVVPELARAAQAQGICYGWRLVSDSSTSFGSNLGDGVRVAGDPRCPRWIEVVAFVVYTPESSEASDSADIAFSSQGVSFPSDASELQRFGLNEAAFINDPGDALTRAVMALPLLAYEHRLAGPVPTALPPSPAPTVSPDASASPGATTSPGPTASASAPPEPADFTDLAGTSSDFWRNRWLLMLIGGLTLLAGAGIAIWTWFEFRRRPTGRPAQPPRPRPAKPTLPARPTQPVGPAPHVGPGEPPRAVEIVGPAVPGQRSTVTDTTTPEDEAAPADQP